MFYKSDFNQIDRKYFKVLTTTCFHIMLQSKSTHYIWDIYFKQSDYGNSLVVYHKHSEDAPFHEQSGIHHAFHTRSTGAYPGT